MDDRPLVGPTARSMRFERITGGAKRAQAVASSASRARRLMLAVVVVAASAGGGACAADDELTVPRPTVPAVTTAPVATAAPAVTAASRNPQAAPAESPDLRPSDPEGSGHDPGGRAQTGSQEPGPGEATGGPDSRPAPESPSTEPSTASASDDGSRTQDSENDRDGAGPDGNMFAARVELQTVLTLEEPIDMAVAPGDGLAWVAERAGQVLRVDTASGEVVEAILDISAETEATGEQGLLGIAVTDRWLFANFTDLDGATRVDAFEREGTGLSGWRRTILTQAQPFRNHNGGDLAIDGDGLLYVGFGDGGAGGDPLDAGQDPTTWLGAVLRIDPTPQGSEPYRVPPDNPFVAGEGPSAAGRPEIFLIGVRNPWRFSFDRVTGDMWIADVGQDRYEEVTVLLAANGGGLGANLGWRLREGLHSYAGDEPPDHADPVWEYGQDDGCSVTGGYVYRGTAIPDLYGAYVFGDYCTSRLWALQISRGEVEFRDLGVEVPGGALASFGEDAGGELYTLSLHGAIARIVPRQ